MTVASDHLGKMEILKVEMGDNTSAGKESWEGLGVEDEGKDKDEGKNVGVDLVSDNTF